jgi:hypothetical protein
LNAAAHTVSRGICHSGGGGGSGGGSGALCNARPSSARSPTDHGQRRAAVARTHPAARCRRWRRGRRRGRTSRRRRRPARARRGVGRRRRANGERTARRHAPAAAAAAATSSPLPPCLRRTRYVRRATLAAGRGEAGRGAGCALQTSARVLRRVAMASRASATQHALPVVTAGPFTAGRPAAGATRTGRWRRAHGGARGALRGRVARGYR